MTVPLSLTISIFVILILGLVEGSRFYGLQADAKDWTKLAAESLFSEYQPFLLEKYEMFLLDGNFGTDTWKIERAEDKVQALLYENFMAKNKADGINLYRMDVSSAEVLGYVLATDENGKVFQMQAAKIMKSTMGRNAAEKILKQIQKVTKEEKAGGNPEESILDANEVLKELAEAEQNAEESSAEQAKGSGNIAEPDGTIPEIPASTEVSETSDMQNPLEAISPIRSRGILSLVLPKGKSISAKTVSVENSLLKRKCRKGTYRLKEQSDWYEKILMQEYIKPLAGNYLEPKKDGALSYGTEYLICGKGSDEENLKATAKKLLGLRETINFLYLQTDDTKKAEALAAATVIAGASANPAVVEVLKQGILAAWAYGESIYDVRALLAGGKIPLVKTAGTWKTQLSKIGEADKGDYSGEKQGLSYENYLDVFLYGKSVKQSAYRSMDLMEMALRQEAEYGDCRMDHMIAGMKLQVDYQADSVFFSIMGKDTIGGYSLEERAEYVYQ